MKYPDFSLKGKVALLTGAGSRGMAAATALTFAHAGADVAVADIKDASDLAQEIKGMGRRSLAVRVDTSRRADVENMVATVVKELGTIDILFNAAAVNLRKHITDTTEEEWDRLMSVNLKGYFLCCREVAGVMKAKKKGVIINVASGAARHPVVTTGAYSVSKAAVAMMTECLALELLPYNIRVNSIGPGAVKSNFNRELWEDPQKLADYESKLPLKRMAAVEDITGIALLLASEASSYMTGQAVYFDTRLLFP